MKFFAPILVLMFFSPQIGFGQDTAMQINSAWTNLKIQLQRRTDIAINLTSILSKSTKVDKVALTNSRTFAIELFKYVDTLNSIDSVSISHANEKNINLTRVLSKSIVDLENDQLFKNNNEVSGLLMQLEGCENRLALEKRNYNDICREFKRTDLLFGSEQMNKTTEIKF